MISFLSALRSSIGIISAVKLSQSIMRPDRLKTRFILLLKSSNSLIHTSFCPQSILCTWFDISSKETILTSGFLHADTASRFMPKSKSASDVKIFCIFVPSVHRCQNGPSLPACERCNDGMSGHCLLF